MKNLLIVFGVIIIIGLIIFATRSLPPGTTLSHDEFMRRYESTNGALLLDVRTPSEFASGHIAGAINIDVQNPSFAGRLSEFDKDKTYFVYCRSGSRSQVAVSEMKKNGFKNVFDLSGGVIGNNVTLTTN